MLHDYFSSPSFVGLKIQKTGIKRTYWYMRDMGYSRYATLRALFFAL
jgi:hypothetical protein